MNTAQRYSTYFSSRGVDPAMYKNARLPYYLIEELGSDKTISILDIGCGFGQNIFAMQNSGYRNIHGIDISEQAISYCREQKLSVEKYDVMEYQGKGYDFILMSHVLEHLPKEKIIPMLTYIRTHLLNTDGRLCVRVPNAQANTGCYWAYEDFTHNTMFTAGSLLFVLREAGFTKIKFLDADGMSGSGGWKKYVRKYLLKIYAKNKFFWNKVTGCTYHKPSPIIFTWEIKSIAYKTENG